MLMEYPPAEVATYSKAKMPDEDVPTYLIEQRYRQYLAVRDLEELFESGEINGLSA